MSDPALLAELRDLTRQVRQLVSALATEHTQRTVGVDDWVSTHELAERTGRHPETVRRWIARGLPAKRLDRSYLIRWGDWLAWQAGAEDAATIDAVLRKVG